MRIVLDLQGAQSETSRFRGIGRYSIFLAKAIVRNRGQHEIIIALNGLFDETIEPIRAAFSGLLPPENIRIWYSLHQPTYRNVKNTWQYDIAILMWEAFLASLQPDIIHILSLFEGYFDSAVTSIAEFDNTIPVSVTLYDLIPLINKKQYFKNNRLGEKHYFNKLDSLSKAKLLLTISESTRQEGQKYLDRNIPMVNISSGIDPSFCPLTLSKEEKQTILAKLSITKPFVLYSGTMDKRKNLVRLVRAYAGLNPQLRGTYQLVLVGSIPIEDIYKIRQEVKSVGLTSDEVIFTNYIDDVALIQLYNLCHLFVFPSLHEGFGLPPLEAMACGAAVIGSNTSSIPEVIGCIDALFDPLSVAGMTAKISQVLQDEGFRLRLQQHSLQQARKFSWDKSAKQAIAAFENLVVSQSPKHIESTKIRPKLLDKIAKIMPVTNSQQDLLHLADILSFNFPIPRTKQILIDVTTLVGQDLKTGIQRVVKGITLELLSNTPCGYAVELVYFTHIKGLWVCRYASEYQNRVGLQNSKYNNDIIAPFCGDIFLGLDLISDIVGCSHQKLFDLWRDIGVKINFVLYDILPVLYPQWWDIDDPSNNIHAQWLQTVTRVADNIICISNSVRSQVKQWLAENPVDMVRPANLTYFHLGADIHNSVLSHGIPSSGKNILLQLEGKINFLMVGTLEPRKGYAQVLQAFESLWDKNVDVNLVIVGKQGWLVDNLITRLQQHEQLNKSLFWLEGTSDEYLTQVYTTATCLIAASEAEGFGLPLIEAAQYKLPIIARDIAVFREVAGKYAYYFRGKDGSDLRGAIKTWLDLYALRKHPVSDNMPWLTWKQSANQLLERIGLNPNRSQEEK